MKRASPGLFRLIYDAFPNELGGNCLTGQLIGEGYHQHYINGLHLYNSYLNNPNTQLNLFPTNVWEKIDTAKQIYLRSDDQERTILSGQIFIDTMFDVFYFILLLLLLLLLFLLLIFLCILI